MREDPSSLGGCASSAHDDAYDETQANNNTRRQENPIERVESVVNLGAGLGIDILRE